MSQQVTEIYGKELKEFEERIKTKSNMPQNIDKMFLMRFLKSCDFDSEKAENLLYKNLNFRKKCPILFTNRDVSSDEFQETRKVCQIFPMPKKTTEGYEVFIFRLIDKDPGKFVGKNILRANITMLDTKYLADDELTNGSIAVIDHSGFTFRHFLKAMGNSSSSKYGKYVHQASPFKPIRVHVVNMSPILRRMLLFIGSFVRRDYREIIKFHDGYETLLEAISKELLPDEFGGSAGSIDDIHSNWVKVLESKRDYILNNDNWNIGEAKLS